MRISTLIFKETFKGHQASVHAGSSQNRRGYICTTVSFSLIYEMEGGIRVRAVSFEAVELP